MSKQYQWTFEVEGGDYPQTLGVGTDQDSDRALLTMFEKTLGHDEYHTIREYDLMNIIHERFLSVVQRLTDYDHAETIAEITTVSVSEIRELGQEEFYDEPESDISTKWEMSLLNKDECLKLSVEKVDEGAQNDTYRLSEEC